MEPTEVGNAATNANATSSEAMRTKIRALRKARGWSQSKLARVAEINASTVCSIENGRLIPYDTQIKKISAAFGIDVAELTESDAADLDATAAASTQTPAEIDAR